MGAQARERHQELMAEVVRKRVEDEELAAQHARNKAARGADYASLLLVHACPLVEACAQARFRDTIRPLLLVGPRVRPRSVVSCSASALFSFVSRLFEFAREHCVDTS